jgi:hypothetical protein
MKYPGIMSLAGFQPTPAEEMQEEALDAGTGASPGAASAGPRLPAPSRPAPEDLPCRLHPDQKWLASQGYAHTTDAGLCAANTVVGRLVTEALGTLGWKGVEFHQWLKGRGVEGDWKRLPMLERLELAVAMDWYAKMGDNLLGPEVPPFPTAASPESALTPTPPSPEPFPEGVDLQCLVHGLEMWAAADGYSHSLTDGKTCTAQSYVARTVTDCCGALAWKLGDFHAWAKEQGVPGDWKKLSTPSQLKLAAALRGRANLVAGDLP